MKKIVLLLAVLLFGAGSMMAQQDKSAEKAAKQAEKEAKKAEKAAKKAAEEAEANALFEQAVQALKNKDFVLEADRIEFKRGSFVYVTPNTNFVSVKGEKATIQLAFNTPAAGPNGIGGITVDGTTSGVQMKTDKKGNVMYEMNVQGVAVSLGLRSVWRKVRINVLPRYHLTLIATVYPLREISILRASRMCSRDVLFNVDTKNREGGLSFGKPAFLFIRRMRLDYFQASFCTR